MTDGAGAPYPAAMRFAFALALTLAACSSDPAPPTDAALNDTSAAVDLGSDTGAVDLGSDTGAADTGQAADAGIDAGQPADTGAVDTGAALDTGPRDTGAVDTDPRQSEVCRGVTAECDGRVVDVQRGEQDGGLVHHCGACGVTCRAGYGCLSCVCIRL